MSPSAGAPSPCQPVSWFRGSRQSTHRDHAVPAAPQGWRPRSAVANIIRKGDLYTLPTAISTGREAGMIPLERSLAKLLDSGTVSPLVVKKIAADHDLLASLSAKLR